MALKITLDKPHNHIWGPGEKVTGKLALFLNEDQNVDLVRIIFQGKVTAKITINRGNHRRHYSHEARMFHVNKILFQGPYTLPAKTHEWPFEFQFPSKATLDFSRDFSSKDFRWTTGPQLLPPTSNDGYGGNGCFINYKVKAEIPRTFNSWKDQLYLTFMPHRLEAVPTPYPNTVSGSDLHIKYMHGIDGLPRELTTRENMYDTFKGSKNIQKFVFRVQIQAPTSLVIGQSIPLQLSAVAVQSGDIHPEICLREIRGSLRSWTYFRAPGTFSDHEKCFDGEIPLGGMLGLNLALPINTTLQLDEILQSNLVPGYTSGHSSTTAMIVPSFSTYSGRKEYDLKFHIIVSCLGKLHDVKLKLQTVIVHSSTTSEPLPSSAEVSAANRSEETLPVYEANDFAAIREAPSYTLCYSS